MMRTERGSRLLSGSSRTSSGGWCRNAAMSNTFCFVPFESVEIGRSKSGSSWKAVAYVAARSVAA